MPSYNQLMLLLPSCLGECTVLLRNAETMTLMLCDSTLHMDVNMQIANFNNFDISNEKQTKKKSSMCDDSPTTRQL